MGLKWIYLVAHKVDHINRFLYVEPSLHRRDEVYLILTDYLFYVSWIQLKHVIDYIYIYAHKGNEYISLFFIKLLC